MSFVLGTPLATRSVGHAACGTPAIQGRKIVTITTDLSPSQADNDLTRRVALFLDQRRLLSGVQLAIDSSRGVVTLRGKSPTFHQRRPIVAATRRVAGAIRI